MNDPFAQLTGLNKGKYIRQKIELNVLTVKIEPGLVPVLPVACN